jgi:hypothetical protein
MIGEVTEYNFFLGVLSIAAPKIKLNRRGRTRKALVNPVTTAEPVYTIAIHRIRTVNIEVENVDMPTSAIISLKFLLNFLVSWFIVIIPLFLL